MRWFVLWLFVATASWAVEPDEMLTDPALEAKAQALDEIIRCVKCRSESIASSNADWARDARLRVRELLDAGATEDDVLNVFVNAYGEVVLMRPTTKGANVALWLAAPFLLLLALFVSWRFIKSPRPVAEPLSPEERAELDDVMTTLRKHDDA